MPICRVLRHESDMTGLDQVSHYAIVDDTPTNVPATLIHHSAILSLYMSSGACLATAWRGGARGQGCRDGQE